MTITEHNKCSQGGRYRDWHILVVAEAGFSQLDFAARAHDLSAETIAAFADQVNRRNEAGSLHPKASISAFPRSLFRDFPLEGAGPAELADFLRHLNEFLTANRQKIKARKILIDLHVSAELVPAAYLDALRTILSNEEAPHGLIEEVGRLAPALCSVATCIPRPTGKSPRAMPFA